jgi:hypothetical protein
VTRNEGTCGTDPVAENEYSKDGQEVGRLLCFSVDGLPQLIWTTASSSIVAVASSKSTTKLADLVRWWKQQGFEQAVDEPVTEPTTPSTTPSNPPTNPPVNPPPSTVDDGGIIGQA